MAQTDSNFDLIHVHTDGRFERRVSGPNEDDPAEKDPDEEDPDEGEPEEEEPEEEERVKVILTPVLPYRGGGRKEAHPAG